MIPLLTVSASTSMSSLRDSTTTTIYSTTNSPASGISMGSPRNKTKSILKQKVIYQGVLSTVKGFRALSTASFTAEFMQVLFSRTHFPSLGNFVNKKVGNRKNLDHFYYISFKSCILGGLSFFDFKLFY